MQTLYYIDTCSLQWRYLSGRATATVDRILSERNNLVFTAELTILEWSSALARAYRRGDITSDQFKQFELALMTDIYNDSFLILRPSHRIIERARYLIEYIGVTNGLNLGSGDAIHLVHALDATKSQGTKLEFVTNDRALSNIIANIDILQASLEINYLESV